MRTFSFALLFAIGLLSQGQSNEQRARAALMKANESYAEKNYTQAVDAFNRSKSYSESSTSEIEYLLTKCFYALHEWNLAEKSLSSYFELAGESDIHYSEMLMMIEDIREMKINEPQKKIASLEEDELWEKIVETRDSTLAFYYLKKFPNGALRQDVCRILTPFDSPPSIAARMYTRYPDKAMNEKVETETHTAILIGSKGEVLRIEHLKVHKYFPVTVENAIHSSGFIPARLNGKPVPGWMIVSLKFGLE